MGEGTNQDAIEPGMPVYGVGGEPLGPVEAIDAAGIRVLNHSVPLAAIARVERDAVHLHLARAAFATAGLEMTPEAGARAADQVQAAERLAVPLVEERLAVGTREMQIGEARITKRVVEEQVMVPVTIRREEIEVIRRGPGEPREEIDDPSVVEVIRFPLRGEEPVIATRPVVTSEVVIGHTIRTEQRQVTGTVRSTEVQIEEHLGEAYARLRPDFETDFADRQRILREAGGAIFRARDFREAEPNYRAGFRLGSDQRYAGRSFEEVEPELAPGQESPGGDPGLLGQIREEIRAGFAHARSSGAR